VQDRPLATDEPRLAFAEHVDTEHERVARHALSQPRGPAIFRMKDFLVADGPAYAAIAESHIRQERRPGRTRVLLAPGVTSIARCVDCAAIPALAHRPTVLLVEKPHCPEARVRFETHNAPGPRGIVRAENHSGGVA